MVAVMAVGMVMVAVVITGITIIVVDAVMTGITVEDMVVTDTIMAAAIIVITMDTIIMAAMVAVTEVIGLTGDNKGSVFNNNAAFISRKRHLFLFYIKAIFQ